MSKYLAKDVFSPDEITLLNNIINNTEIPIVDGTYVGCNVNDDGTGLHPGLGRLQIGNIAPQMPQDMKDKLEALASDFAGVKLTLDHAAYAEYNGKYGTPNLPPHFDGDTNDLIINYQLESNTDWDLGIDLATYNLEDNSALVFNANTTVHWRVHKEFKEGEYVKMLFIRFYEAGNRKDYSFVPMNSMDEVFAEIRNFRDSLRPKSQSS